MKFKLHSYTNQVYPNYENLVRACVNHQLLGGPFPYQYQFQEIVQVCKSKARCTQLMVVRLEVYKCTRCACTNYKCMWGMCKRVCCVYG